MKSINLKYEIISKKDFYKIVNKENIFDSIELGDHLLIGLNIESDEDNNNISIGVAAAITAYARIHMSQFKNNPDYILYYTDTDSGYFDRALPSTMVNSKVLGKMKLENVLDRVIFLAPKVYYLITENGDHIYKVKGLTHDVELNLKDFENLLFKESFLKKLQTKWRRNLSEGNVSILNEVYTLKVTSNKRKLIYENGKLIGTKPYIINSEKEILNK